MRFCLVGVRFCVPDLWPKSCQWFNMCRHKLLHCSSVFGYLTPVCASFRPLQSTKQSWETIRSSTLTWPSSTKTCWNKTSSVSLNPSPEYRWGRARRGSAEETWHCGVLLSWAGPEALHLWCFWCQLTPSRLVLCFQIEHISGLIKLSKVRSCWWTVLSLFSSVKCGFLLIVSFWLSGKSREEIITDDPGQEVPRWVVFSVPVTSHAERVVSVL